MIKGRKNGSLPGQSIKCATDSCPMGSHPDLSPADLAGQGSGREIPSGSLFCRDSQSTREGDQCERDQKSRALSTLRSEQQY